MWPDRVSNPGPPTYESDALPIALRGPAFKELNGKLSLNYPFFPFLSGLSGAHISFKQKHGPCSSKLTDVILG